VHDAAKVSESWSDFVLEAALAEVWWRYPVCAVNNVFRRIRYLFGDVDSRYNDYWVGSLTGRSWV